MMNFRNELEGTELVTNNVRKNFFNRKLQIRIVVAILVLVVVAGISATMSWKMCKKITKEEEPNPATYISGKMEDVSDLTTQTLTYTSYVPWKEGNIPFINERSFVMQYNATIRAGFDLSKMEIKDGLKDKIIIRLPYATVQGEPNIDPNSIKFMDENKAIFNWESKEDTVKAIEQAKKDFDKDPNVNMEQFLEEATEHAEELMHTLFDDVFEKEIVIEFEK